MQRPGDWICPNCKQVVFANRAECFRCPTQRPLTSESSPHVSKVASARSAVRSGDWNCPKCKQNVYASKNVCFRCQFPKPKSIPDQGSRNCGLQSDSKSFLSGDSDSQSIQSNTVHAQTVDVDSSSSWSDRLRSAYSKAKVDQGHITEVLRTGNKHNLNLLHPLGCSTALLRRGRPLFWLNDGCRCVSFL